MSKKLRIIFCSVLGVLLLSSIALGMGSSPRYPQIKIEKQDAMLSPMMLGVGSVFMKIENAGDADDALISARVNIPGTVTEIHNVKDGKMVKIEKIAVPAKGIVELRPRSLHIMIFKMPKDIKEGYEFTLYLMFERSGEKEVPVKFSRPADTHMHHNR